MNDAPDLQPVATKPEPTLQLSPHGETVRMMGALTTSLARSLAELESQRPDSRTNLGVPGKLLIFLGGAVIFISIALRVIPTLLSSNDFIASLCAGCILELAGVFLFVYQYRAEQAKTTAVVNTTERVTKGLVAILGTDKS
jgi:hypothetical protein